MTIGPAFGTAAIAIAAVVLPGTATAGAVAGPPVAAQLFERDWVLMNWAIRQYDGDRDILLSPTEAARAAAEFRKIADSDDDGRITPTEYRAAREFILARY